MANQKTFNIDTSKTYSPAEAQALLANLVANPIPAVNGTRSVDTYIGATNARLQVTIHHGKSGYHVEDTRIDDQSAKPTRPETRYITTSSYGKVIPISMGRRRIDGNLIACSPLSPRLVGNKQVTVHYQVPIYEDPPVDPELGLQLDTSGGNGTGTSSTCGAADACDTRQQQTTGPGDAGWYWNRTTLKDLPEPQWGQPGWRGPYPDQSSALAAMPDDNNTHWTCVKHWSGIEFDEGFCD